MSDPYVYPGTDVLINKAGIRDREKLEQFERLVTAQRMLQPRPPTPITYDGYKDIHRHVFQDVYDWAGQPRTVDISKGNSYFGRTQYVDAEMTKQFALIQAENRVQLQRREHFVERAAEHVGELNAIHPFREGNGRTVRRLRVSKSRTIESWRRLLITRLRDRSAWLNGNAGVSANVDGVANLYLFRLEQKSREVFQRPPFLSENRRISQGRQPL